MTFLVTLMLGAGILLVVSGLGGGGLRDTFASLIRGGQDLNLSASNLTSSGARSNSLANLPANARAEVQSGTAAFIAPYPVTQSEYPVADAFNGIIASCVETAGAIAAAFTGKYPLSTSTIQSDVTSLMNTPGQYGGKAAKPGGATLLNYETDLLKSKYDVNTITYPLPNPNTQQLIQQAVQQNQPIIWGIGRESGLVDVDTGYRPAFQGGHAITIEGYDQAGVYAADPDTPDPGTIHHYSWQSLLSSEGGSFAVVTG